jgi:hypothetical protein
MRRTRLFAAFILAGAATGLAAQSTSTSKPPAPPVTKAITLVGCIQPDAAKPEWFTLSDTKTGTTYRLYGADVKEYVWRKVRIIGGLVPSANIAAQAGAIDHTKVATAYQDTARPGPVIVEPLEFSVTRVRRLTGSCAPKVR